MEHITVKYPHHRIVHIDGQEAGYTNRTLRVGAGTHTINLGEPRDYTPKWRRPRVTGTTVINPMAVVFEEKQCG